VPGGPEASCAMLKGKCHRGGPTSLTTALGAGNVRSHRVPELDAGGLEHDSADQLGGYANHLS
jgi:hypothetical protein